ncbi:MAG: hypothetical protein OXE58_10100, partial [Acidobacteria bacterium]|nr:hypothetical protein [Acidobacteriota bacterium]
SCARPPDQRYGQRQEQRGSDDGDHEFGQIAPGKPGWSAMLISDIMLTLMPRIAHRADTGSHSREGHR